jgi:hypothetical protein
MLIINYEVASFGRWQLICFPAGLLCVIFAQRLKRTKELLLIQSTEGFNLIYD